MKFLFIDTHLKENGEYGGIGYYRLQKPAQYLRKLGHEVDFYTSADFQEKTQEELLQAFVSYFSQYDAVVSKNNSNQQSLSAMLFACWKTKTKFISDLDDNYMEVLSTQPAWKLGYQKGEKERTVISTQLSFSDALFVSTQPLKDYFQKMLKEAFNLDTPIYVLPNGNDLDDWDFPSETNKDKVVIGWMGSITHDQDLHLVFPALGKLMSKHKNLHFEVMGGATERTFSNQNHWDEESYKRIHGVTGTSSFRHFPEVFMKNKWDIGIAPLVDCEFNRAKSHIKWMEYTMKGIPTVASDVYPYTQAITNNEDGILVSDNWEDALERLITDKKLRDKLAKNALQTVKKNHQYKNLVKLWDEALTKVCAINKE
jgi:glycosyltransferase involved in cell wall biosynthesis